MFVLMPVAGSQMTANVLMRDAPIGWTSPPEGSEACLSRALLSIRSNRPRVDASLPYTAYPSGRMVQIWINSPVCRFSLAGKCTICDYWEGVASENAVDKVCEYIEIHGDQYVTLLLNTCGSCFCEEELPFQSLLRIMKVIAKSLIQRVIFESHLMYVNIEKIKVLAEVLNDKEIVLEYGQESTSSQVLKYCLNKPSMLTEYKIIKDLQQNGVKVFANVVLGTPFLTVCQRIQDTVDSVHDLLQYGVDGVVLFPINIKPYTLIKYLFDYGYYKRVNALEIVKVLERFNEDELARIELAWFEPQREIQVAYPDTERGLGPRYCDQCGTAVLENLFNYRQADDGKLRRSIISQPQEKLCDCVNNLYDYNIPDIHVCYMFLENKFSQGGVYAVN
jgi:radical SAM enzyme (TIGR01210 family)